MLSHYTGTFPGAAGERSYELEVRALGRPDRVRVDGTRLAEVAPGAAGPGWWYDEAASTLHVQTAPLPTGLAHSVKQRGGAVRDRT